MLNKFIEQAEAVLPKGHYMEQSGNKIYIYKDQEHKFMPNNQGQKYIYMFYKQEILDAPNDCLGLLRTILNLG